MASAKQREFAPGIPDKKRIEPLPEVGKPQNWRLAIQEHAADRAGKHYDLRLVDPATGFAHSWALPKAMLPEPGKSVLAVQQPTHTSDYALNFSGNIPSGYGKGDVKLKEVVDTEVFHATPSETGTRLRFNTYKSTGPEEYAIVRTSGGNDLLVNKTLSRERLKELEVGQKPKTRELKLDNVDVHNDDEVMMPKYDGAHTLLSLRQKGRIPRLFSYRIPAKHSAGVIEHTHKVPSLLETRVPASLVGTVLRAETVAVDSQGKAIPARDIAGMLNSTVPNSRKKQQQMKAELKTIILDVEKYKHKDVRQMPFNERYELMKDINKQTGLAITDVAITPIEKQKLLDDIRGKRHMMTEEGVVLRPMTTPGAPVKAKFRPDYDVHIRDIFPTEKKDRAGGFTYSWSPRGKVVGRVGTGFNHALARDMLNNPAAYKGRVAKVEAETKYPSGALSKASFKEWHLDKGNIE